VAMICFFAFWWTRQLVQNCTTFSRLPPLPTQVHVHPLTCETWSDQGTSDLLPVDESHFTAEENSWIFFGASDGSMGEQNPYGCMYVCMYVCMTSGKECGGVVNKLTGTCATSTASIGAGRAPVVLGEIFLENKISKSKSRILKPFFAP
jgi:hypothetical protein